MALPLTSVLTRHAEEAATLWLLRDQAVHRPDYDLGDLAKLDNRVEAHLDGLRIAGDDGWRFALEQLDAHPEPGETFATAVLAFEAGNLARMARVLETAVATPGNGRALVSALGWLDETPAVEHARHLLHEESAVSRRLGLAARAVHRRPSSKHLSAAFRSSDAALRARAYKAAGELGDLN